MACENSKSFFEALERNVSGIKVIRVNAIEDNRMPHVLMVPMYDVVLYEQGQSSIYGPNSRLVSILNNDQKELLKYVSLSDNVPKIF